MKEDERGCKRMKGYNTLDRNYRKYRKYRMYGKSRKNKKYRE